MAPVSVLFLVGLAGCGGSGEQAEAPPPPAVQRRTVDVGGLSRAYRVSVIEIHGTADPLVPYEGGHTAGGATKDSPPTPAVVQRWAELNRCPAPAATQTEGPVTTSTWNGCAEGTAVKLVTIDGGGHTWFAPGLGTANGAVDATATIWSFLSAVRR
ncbi:MAG: hypothetical protein ABR540_11020 [Acidimicrobiales bacterium]